MKRLKAVLSLVSNAQIRHWSEIRSEPHKPLIISELTVLLVLKGLLRLLLPERNEWASREQRQLSQLGLSAARSVLAAHSLCPCVDFWTGSGEFTDR